MFATYFVRIFSYLVAFSSVQDSFVVFQPPILALDPDSPTPTGLAYSLESSEESRYFTVDQTTAEVRVASALPEAGRKLALLLKVEPCWTVCIFRTSTNPFKHCCQVSKTEDPRLFSSTLLTVHIQSANENAPRFVPSTYFAELRENLPRGSHVLRVTAVDDDEVTTQKLFTMLCFVFTYKIELTSHDYIRYNFQTVFNEHDEVTCFINFA